MDDITANVDLPCLLYTVDLVMIAMNLCGMLTIETIITFSNIT